MTSIVLGLTRVAALFLWAAPPPATAACAAARTEAPDSVYIDELKCRGGWLEMVWKEAPADVDAKRVAEDRDRLAFVARHLESSWKRRQKPRPAAAGPSVAGTCAAANLGAPDDAYAEELRCQVRWLGFVVGSFPQGVLSEDVADSRRRIVVTAKRLESSWKRRRKQ